MLKQRIANYFGSLSFTGLTTGILFLCVSVTPSLLPRHYVVQGLLSGLSLAIGYGVGVGLLVIYRFLELKEPKERVQQIGRRVIGGLLAITVLASFWRMTAWQNSIRDLMQMPALESAYHLRVACIAVLFAVMLLAVSRLLLKFGQYLSTKLQRFVPRRIANAIGFFLVVLGLFLLTNDVIAVRLLHAVDKVFLKIDEVAGDDLEQPADSQFTGSDESRVPWKSIGKQGKLFVLQGPAQADITKFHDATAKHPIRVYVGLRSRETMQERARLALEELKRQGGFERSVLIVATPTGTGWLDPSGVDTVEYLHRGDTAIVSMQYSYLPSWITLPVDPGLASESATALFDVIYAYWRTLPKTSRPELYLHGLSLGALGSESSVSLYTVFEDPIQGAVWSGTPFPARGWQEIVKHRNEGSPVWLPEINDGRMVRFTSQKDAVNTGDAWGPIRVVFIQHASDPMVWFSPDLAWRRPDWLNEPRGPDVSPHLGWFPIVTFLQTACDLPMATAVPLGYGHNYAPSAYIDAWLAVTEPENWTPEMTTRLKELFKQKATPKP